MSKSSQFSDRRRRPEESSFAQTCNLLSRYVKERGTLRDLNLEIGGKVESLESIVKPGSSLAASASTAMDLRRKSGEGSSEKQPSMDSSVVVVEDATNKAITSKDGTKTEPNKTAQLTMFYSGRVLVFDDYPVEKVRELVSIAKKSSSQMSYGILSNAIQEKTNNGVAVASNSGSRERLPPKPQAGNGKQPVVIPSNTCQEKTNCTTGEAVASSSRSGEQLSPQSEANGSDLPIARRSSLHRFLEKRKDRAAVRGPYQNQEQQPAPSSKGDIQIDLNMQP